MKLVPAHKITEKEPLYRITYLRVQDDSLMQMFGGGSLCVWYLSFSRLTLSALILRFRSDTPVVGGVKEEEEQQASTDC